MNKNYTFDDFEQELDNGYQIFFTYVRNRYVIFKTADNCYTQKLISEDEKNPQPQMQIITKKRLDEIFPFMEDVEYKYRDN